LLTPGAGPGVEKRKQVKVKCRCCMSSQHDAATVRAMLLQVQL
jgi:hypothetical protein